jgi:hypothetical protein
LRILNAQRCKTRITQIEEGIEPIDNAEHIIAELKDILKDLNPADDFIGTVFDTTFRTAGGKNHMSKSGKKQKMSARKS